jgi:hypothetical protein
LQAAALAGLEIIRPPAAVPVAAAAAVDLFLPLFLWVQARTRYL